MGRTTEVARGVGAMGGTPSERSFAMNLRGWMLILWTSTWLMVAGLVTAQTPPAAGDQPVKIVDPRALIEDALRKIDAGEFEEAATLAEQAQALKPSMDRLRLVRGLLLLESVSSPPEAAIRVLDEYNRTPTGKVDYRGLAAIGRVYLRSRWYRQASRSLRAAAPLAPQQENDRTVKADILMDLATAERALNQPENAVRHAREARDLSRNNAHVLFRYAEVIAMADDPKALQDAVTATQAAIRRTETELRESPFDKDRLEVLRSASALLVDIHRKRAEREPESAAIAMAIARAMRDRSEADKRLNMYAAYDAARHAFDMTAQPGPDWQVFMAELEIDVGGAGALQTARDRLHKVLEAKPDNKSARRLLTRIDALATQSSKP